jgi:hypothetical protein
LFGAVRQVKNRSSPVAISDVQQALLSVGTIASQNMSSVSIDGSDDVMTQTHWYGPSGFGVKTTEVVFTANPNDGGAGDTVLYSVVNSNGVHTTPAVATILGYDANYVLLQDSNGTDLLVANAGQLKASDSSLFPITDISAYTAANGAYSAPPAYPAVVCFVAGTRIRTERGEVAVEDLVEGDLVHVLDDAQATRPVTWIGYRDINLTAHPDPIDVQPIRIKRDAFAQGMPARDLLVSPPHAVFTGGHLIPARMLVNGASIVREKRLTKFRYYHVELDEHAILFSEGMTSESYVECGNRAFFQNGGVVDLNAGFVRMSPADIYESKVCAPFVHDPAAVRPVWEQLSERAAELGYAPPPVATTTDPDPRLGAGDREIRPLSVANGQYTFVVPPFRTEVRLITRAARPCEARPLIAEHRTLGVTVSRVRVRHGRDVEDLPLDGGMFGQGWWDIERDGERMWRWTNGNAVLRLPEARGPGRVLEITMGGGMTYALAPADEAMETEANAPADPVVAFAKVA